MATAADWRPFCCASVAMDRLPAAEAALAPEQDGFWDDRYATLMGAFCQWARRRPCLSPLTPRDAADARIIVVMWRPPGERDVKNMGQAAFRYSGETTRDDRPGAHSDTALVPYVQRRYNHAFRRVHASKKARGALLAVQSMHCARGPGTCGRLYVIRLYEAVDVTTGGDDGDTDTDSSAPEPPVTPKTPTARASIFRRMSIFSLPTTQSQTPPPPRTRRRSIVDTLAHLVHK